MDLTKTLAERAIMTYDRKNSKAKLAILGKIIVKNYYCISNSIGIERYNCRQFPISPGFKFVGNVRDIEHE